MCVITTIDIEGDLHMFDVRPTFVCALSINCLALRSIFYELLIVSDMCPSC